MSDMQGGAASFQAANSVGGGFIQAAALRDQADYEKKLAELNNKTLEYQAEQASRSSADAYRQGMSAVAAGEGEQREKQGKIRAAAAARGVSGSEGEAGLLASLEADRQTEVRAAKTNAIREAYGLTAQSLALEGAQAGNNFKARSKANALEYMAYSSMITGINEGIGKGFQAGADYQKGQRPTTGGVR